MAPVKPISRRRAAPGPFLGPRTRFCLGFAAILGLLAAGFQVGQEIFAHLYLRPVSEAAALLLGLARIPAHLDASHTAQGFCTISLPALTFRVIHECTGLFTLFIYLAAVLAFPVPWRSRLVGAAGGAVAFLAYSSLRLVALGVVGYARPEWVVYAHSWLMVLTNLGYALFIWLVWAERVKGHVQH